MKTEGRKFTFLCGHDSTVASVLAALGAEEYRLPGAIEPSTPIGVKPLENPPMIVPVHFAEAQADENGMIPEEGAVKKTGSLRKRRTTV